MNLLKIGLLIIAIIFSFNSSSAKPKKGIKISVQLSPAGSFVATSKKIKGKLIKKGGQFIAKNIKVPVKSLKTGIKLRDEHFQKKIGGKKAALLLIELKGKNGKGKAIFKVSGKKQKVNVVIKELSNKWAQFKFKLSNKKFGLDGISYMGVGVEDIVDVTVTLPFKTK